MTDTETAPARFKYGCTLTKIDPQQRVVSGRATQEIPDHSREIMDYDSSVPFFQKWSADTEKRTVILGERGKSLGNLREMHDAIAAGKVTGIHYNDVEKAIDIDTYVSDDDTWKKILDGVLTGFSIGGEYGKQWPDPRNPRMTRFTAIPSEISYVDNPAVPTATYSLIKADGTSEMRKVGEALISALPVNPGNDAPANATDAPPASIEVVDTLDKPRDVPMAGGEIAVARGLIDDSNAVPVNEPKDTADATALKASIDQLLGYFKAAADEKAAQEKKLKQLGARVGIARKDGEPLTPPKGYPDDPADYADPANFSWPADKSRYSSARGYYNAGKGKDKYTASEWKVLGRRIVRLANRFDAGYKFDSGNNEITDSKDSKKMAEFTLSKDMDAAGLLAQLKAALSTVADKIGSDPEALENLLMEGMRSAKPADTSNPGSNPTGTSAGSISTAPSDVSGKTAATTVVTPAESSSSSSSSGSSDAMKAITDSLAQLTALVTKQAETQANIQQAQIVKTVDGQMIPVNNLAALLRPPQHQYPGMTPVVKAFMEGGPAALKKAAELAGTKDNPDVAEATNQLMLFVREDMAESGMFSKMWADMYGENFMSKYSRSDKE